MYKEFVDEIQIWVLTADAYNSVSLDRFIVQKILSKNRQRKQAWLRQARVLVLLRVCWFQM